MNEMTADQVIEILGKILKDRKYVYAECERIGATAQAAERLKEINAIDAAIHMLEYTCKVDNRPIDERKDPYRVTISSGKENAPERPREVVIRIQI